MRHLTRILTVLAIVAVAPSSIAVAKAPVLLAPPGESAVSQYAEVVPNDLGASPPRAGGSAQGRLGSIRRLDRLGADGRLLATVVASTAPPPLAGSEGQTARGPSKTAVSGTSQSARGSGPASGISAAGAASPGSQLLSAAEGGGSGVLGILLVAITVAAAGVGLARAIRHRRPQ